MKNNGQIFTPSGPLHQQDAPRVINWMKRWCWRETSPPTTTPRVNHLKETELILSSVNVSLKEAAFHSDCEQLTGDAGCEKVLLGYFFFCHMEGRPIVCTAPSLQGLVVPLSGDELWWGATSPAPSLNRWQLPFITALLATILYHQHPRSTHAAYLGPLTFMKSLLAA